KKSFLGRKIPELKFIYPINGKINKELPFEDESMGTQRLFKYAAFMLEAIDKNITLIIDELNASLHPKALEGVIQLFKNKAKNAQLIFTSHDAITMDLMRKDEVWLVEKGNDLATKLYSVADFKNESNNVISKRYLSGRYGAIPDIEVY
ncbi:MAG: ATP-binding protein, partial [Pseudomonadota bacterium]